LKPNTFLNIFILTIISSVLGFVFGVLYWGYLRPVDLYGTGISDEEYARIAEQTVEVQNFLKKYPNAKVLVDRSGKLAVDFRVNKPDDAVIAGNYLRLRVFINPRNNLPIREKFFDCSGRVIRDNLLEYLQTERCLE